MKQQKLNELHLFAGAGGGILGGILCGHTCVCAVEIETYPRKVLLQRQRDGILPHFPIWDDVRTFDGKPWRGKVDIVCGGFPCQDISSAGKGVGITGERSGYGRRWLASLEKSGPGLRLWKTRQFSLLGGLEPFLETWPKWGMMRGGECLEVPTPERATTEKEFGFLPTPNASDCRSRGNFAMESIRRRVTIGKQIGLSNYFKGAPCPICVERVMRWPMGWTGLELLETDKIRFVQPSLGNSFQEWLDINAKALETSFQYDTRREKTKK